MRFRTRRSPWSIAVLLSAGCASVSTPTPASAPAAPTPTAADAPEVPPGDNLNAVLWAQRAIEHDLVFLEVYRNAGQKLDAALADPDWNGLPNEDREGSAAGLPAAVIIDVDEAALDNSSYQARLVRSGEEFSEFTWSEWCKEKAARPLPGAVDFTQPAADLGVAFFFISNRARDLDKLTPGNSCKVGFPLAADSSFLGVGTVLKGV